MTYDTIVVGAGLAGLSAALRLAEAGKRVLVLAKGVGATHLAPATIDVLGYDNGPVEIPARALAAFAAAHPQHPYARLPLELIRASLEWFTARLAAFGYRGGLDENFILPTAVGVAKPTAVVPETMAAGDLRAGGAFAFVGLRGLKDFYPAYAADNLSRAALPSGAAVSARAIELEPSLGGEADVSGLGFARRFDDRAFRERVARELRARLEPGERVGFPAVLGLARAGEVWRELEARLERPVFEVPTLPPSVPGIRLFEAMTTALRRAGGRIVLGDEVVGSASGGGRVEAVAAQAAARPTTHTAPSFVLASGGFASGGLQMDSFGTIREVVFGLPLACLPPPEQPRFEPGYFDDHPMSRVGVAVDDRLRPLDGDGRPVFANVHVAGATLAGAVSWRDGSGNGVSLATGYAAAEAILEEAS